jgi:peptide deformylase
MKDPLFASLLFDMAETFMHHKAAGLAAIQVGSPDRVLLALNTETGLPVICINPEVLSLFGGASCVQEGCLSFPGITANVYRHKKAAVSYLNADGNPVSSELNGFEAQIFQHELKHLDGRLLIDELPKAYKKSFIDRFNSTRRKSLRSQAPNL